MKKFSFLSLSIFVFGFLTCISCGYLVSTAVLSFSAFQENSTISFEKQTVYAISVANAQSKEELSAKAVDLQAKNGAGFVYEKDENFYLLSSLYDNVNDAELVKTNLKNSNIEAEILSIQIEAIKVEGNFSTEEKNILTNAMKANYETFKSLYDVAISLDTGVFDKTKAKLECNNIFSNLVAIKTNFETFFKDKQDENLTYVQQSLQNSYDILSNLISENYENQSQNFSSLIKLSYCKILL